MKFDKQELQEDDIADAYPHKAVNARTYTWWLKFPLSSSVSQTGRRAADTTRQVDQRQGGGELSWTGLRGDRIQWERGKKRSRE